MEKRHRAHLILHPNHGDRDLSWTRQNPRYFEMCCVLVQSATICGVLSGPCCRVPLMNISQAGTSRDELENASSYKYQTF